jgi:S-(hydroxymethyl)glutathione dehydrogenase/alcohol dehydrogenase
VGSRLEGGGRAVHRDRQLDGEPAAPSQIEPGICRTDEFTRSGADPEGLTRCPGHEGAGVVSRAGVKSLKRGDHVIPLYVPSAASANTVSRRPIYASRPRDQGRGSCRTAQPFSVGARSCTTTWARRPSPTTRSCEIALAKIREDAPFDKVCYRLWSAGIGAGQHRQRWTRGERRGVRPGRHGAQRGAGARLAGANMIVGVA